MTLRTLSVVMSHVSYFWPLNLMGWNSMNVSGCYPLRPLLSEQGQHGPYWLKKPRTGLDGEQSVMSGSAEEVGSRIGWRPIG